jgi:hypothetical protein
MRQEVIGGVYSPAGVQLNQGAASGSHAASSYPGRPKLDELESRKAALEAELAAAPSPAPRLHPNLAEIYRRKVADL